VFSGENERNVCQVEHSSLVLWYNHVFGIASLQEDVLYSSWLQQTDQV